MGPKNRMQSRKTAKRWYIKNDGKLFDVHTATVMLHVQWLRTHGLFSGQFLLIHENDLFLRFPSRNIDIRPFAQTLMNHVRLI